MRRSVKFALSLFTLALFMQPHLQAQAVYGSIFGTVTDASGGVIPNAEITVTDVAKGTSSTQKSNGTGDFTVDHLIPDVYNVKVTISGYKTFEQTGVQVFADTRAKVSPAMTVGGTTQTVQVRGDTVPQLKVGRADVSTIFNARQIVDLPVPDRNFTNLQLLLPGAQQIGFTHAASENPQASKQIQVDGQTFAGTAFELDGTDNQDPILGIIVVNPNPDSLSEAKITVQNYDASFGKAVSSVVTAQTKSGTNSFHGTAFDYRESNANLARDPFTQGPRQLSASNPFPAGLKNQFGGSIGGPIIKDKVFFFGDYQGNRQKVGIANVQTVPSAQLVSSCLGQTTAANGVAGCDFSEYATALAIPQLIYRPNTNTPYPGNVIPAAEISPQAIGLLRLLQPYAPNSPGSLNGLRNNYAASGIGGFNSDQWDVRGDWTSSATSHVFGRFSRFTDTLTGTTMFGPAGGAGFGLGGYGGTSVGANDSAAAGLDVALNATTAFDVRLGYFRYGINTSKYDQQTPLATQLGIPGLNTAQPITGGAPAFNITEVNTFGSPSNGQASGPQYGAGLNVNRCNCPLSEHEDQYQIVNNWTKTIGSHELKFGADLRYARNLRVPSDQNRAGILNFGTGPTSGGTAGQGLGFATFVLGDVSSFQRYVSTSTNAKEFQKRTFFFAQDTWRVNPALTINYGLRYEIYFPEAVNARGNGALLNLSTGYLQVAGYGNIGSDMNQTRPNNTYAPRLGVTYQVNPKLVIRSGYGRSFDIGVFGSIFGHSATQNLPVLASQSLSAAGGDNATDNDFAFNLADGPTALPPTNVPASGLLPTPGNIVSARSRPTTLRLPTIDAWNLSLQQAITPTLSLTVAYVGNKGTHTFGDASGNTTNPNESGIFLPPQFSVTGNGLHYDPRVPKTTNAGGYAGVAADGGTANQTLLSRYFGGSLPACADPNYGANGGVRAPNGGCGWNQGITYFGDNLDTHYNALQVTMEKRFVHGYSINANYAWQQSIDEAVNYSTWNRQAVRGRDSILRQQQIIVYGIFNLPFGRNRQFLNHVNGFVNQIISDIQISPVVNYSSGLPYNLCGSQSSTWVPGSAPCYVNGNAGSFQKQVSGFPGQNLQWFPAQSLTNGPFSTPALDQIGSSGRSSQFGPNYFNTDLSIQKTFQLYERLGLVLRADGFNAFNHINWGNPVNAPNVNIDQAGSITCGASPNCTANPRQLQFSGRFEF